MTETSVVTDQPVTPAEYAELRKLKERYRELDKEAAAAKAKHDAYQAQLIERMRSTDSFSYKSGEATYSRKSTIYATVQDRDAFIEWCKANDLADELLREKEAGQPLNEIVRARIDNGEELPPGVGFYSRDYISISANTED